MRLSMGLAGFVVLLGSRVLCAQSAANEMSVAVPDVEVRSGPGPLFNVTSKLRLGDRVTIVQDPKAQPGWVAIKPPLGSYSWIEAKNVLKQQNTPIAAVIGEGPAAVRPGSAVTTKPPDRESTRVNPGALVAIVGKELVTDAGTWLPIEPPPQDVRYLPQEALRASPALAGIANPPPPPASENPAAIITQADRAFQAGQIEQAKQLYRQALDRPLDNLQRVYCQNRLTSLGASQPGNPQWTAGNPNLNGQTTALYRTNPNGTPAPLTQPQWSVWGQLRQTAFQKDGLPMYVLENRQGTPLLYITTHAGFSLRDYIGKTVSLYGAVTYRSDEYMRMHYMTASHVATLPQK